MTPCLADLSRCFQGIIPSAIATCSADGVPNVTLISQLHYVDAAHLAISCQFFNKTRRNLEENPHALDESAAPEEAPVADGPMNEFRALSLVSGRVNRARDLETLYRDVLDALDEVFRFRHAIVFLADEKAGTLVAIASHGYGESGIGAEVRMGEGLVGYVAAKRVPVRLSGMDELLRYGRAVRGRVEVAGDASGLTAEVPLPGLPDAESQLALPLVVEDRLVGVLAIESRNPLACAEWHEAFLSVLANQIAIGIDRLSDVDEEPAPAEPCPAPAPPAGPARAFVYFRNDDCIFVDGEYLVRNVPAKILWKLLNENAKMGRREFTNRELRLDPSLGLPAYKDNLESRLILLKKRLEDRCFGVRIVPIRRGRFALEVAGAVALEERAG